MSSPSVIISSGTSGTSEIVPAEETSHSPFLNKLTQIETTHSATINEDGEPASGGVVYHLKAEEQSKKVSFLCPPFNSGQKASRTKSIGDKPTLTVAADTTINNSSNRIQDELDALSNLIEADLKSMENSRARMSKCDDSIRAVTEKFKKLKEDSADAEEFRELKKDVKKLKQLVSSKHKVEAEDFELLGFQRLNDSANVNRTITSKVLEKMPNLYRSTELGQSLVFKDFEARYHKLEDELKLCLLCFSVFPEKMEIKKRVMLYWWIGEGFVPPLRRENTAVQEPNTASEDTKPKTAEQFANKFFNKLIEEGFIEAVYKKNSLQVDACVVHPFVRAMLIKLAKAANFFDFDDEGNAKADYSESLRACLTGKGLTDTKCLEKLHALFNVSEAILEFKPEWFLKMKNINVLYLGRWQNAATRQTAATHHIEVEDSMTLKTRNANVLDGLENMKYLRFLSLQGISRITKLPASILKVTNLTILDLRACHNLEELPEGIGLLKNLTHLDMSECYLLDQMPKGLASLSKLEVLNGFVVGESAGKHSCTLDDMRKLTMLRKLSICTGVDEFPSERERRALYQFKKLRKLTIAWGRGSMQASQTKDSGAEQGNPAAKRPGPQRPLTISSTSKTTAGTPRTENREDGKNRGISAAEQAAASADKSGLERANQASGTPRGVNREDGRMKGIGGASPAKRLLRTLTGPSRPPESTIRDLLPEELEKLDLQCFPFMNTPHWLMPCNLKKLKKLYIRGGKFSDLGQFQEIDIKAEKHKWEGVIELRLKYLTEIEMDWWELQELFPKLSFLEKVKCPKLTFFPCDGTGVWIKKQ